MNYIGGFIRQKISFSIELKFEGIVRFRKDQSSIEQVLCAEKQSLQVKLGSPRVHLSKAQLKTTAITYDCHSNKKSPKRLLNYSIFFFIFSKLTFHGSYNR